MNPTVIGEALVDVLASGIAPAQEFVGGSPLNVAVALSRLGYPGTLISRWGADDKGRKSRNTSRTITSPTSAAPMTRPP